MTYNNSSINKNTHQKSASKTSRKSTSLHWHSLYSYWWLAVICLVVYGFAGPVYMLLQLDVITRNYNVAEFVTEELFRQNQLSELRQILQMEGFLPIYFAAVILAAVIGCVMFFYLQQKRQVNFYHSQPISRTRLFFTQYVTGILVNLIPMFLMFVATLGTIVAYGLGDALEIGAVLQHAAYIVLFSLSSYSIAVLSGQLAGTMMTQMAVNAVLHFAIPVATWTLTMLCELFFATTCGIRLLEDSIKFSPMCAMIQYLSDASAVQASASMAIQPLDFATTLVNILIFVGLLFLAWGLYQKRPSEATGKALVYPVTEPILKGYLMFEVGIIAGLIFVSVGNKLFFYFAVISFAVLTHMTCEVIIQHDFRAMTKRMSHCAVLLVLILAIVGIFRFDVINYDAYLPKPDQVARVSLVIPAEDGNIGLMEEWQYSGDPAVKQAVYDLLEPIVTGQQYQSSDFNGSRTPYIQGNEITTYIQVCYELQNGRTTSRCYQMVCRDAFRDAYEALYNQQAYREAYYSGVLKISPEYVVNMHVNDNRIYEKPSASEVANGMTNEMTDVEMVYVEAKRNFVVASTESTSAPAKKSVQDSKNYKIMAELLEAYQKDVKDRQFDTITKPCITSIQLNIMYPDSGVRDYLRASVYEEDLRTMAVLNQYSLQENAFDRDYPPYSEALIFRCDPLEETELRNMIGEEYYDLEKQYMNEETGQQEAPTIEACIEAFQGKAELTGRITGTEAIRQFVEETDLLLGSGLFAQFDTSHFVLLKYDNAFSRQLFYADTVPFEYQ